jgi:hypothetical protein
MGVTFSNILPQYGPPLMKQVVALAFRIIQSTNSSPLSELISYISPVFVAYVATYDWTLDLRVCQRKNNLRPRVLCSQLLTS